MLRYLIIVEGRVQGVGFRYFAQSNASIHKITGSVRNMENGMVEIEAQGPEENINLFISKIKEGNRFIRVDDFSMKKLDVIQGENKFKVKY